MSLKIGTVCSGIGFSEMALKALGLDFEVEYFCEIDKHAATSYKAIHGVPDNKNLIDLTTVDIELLPKDLDLAIGGTPCQDFSNAGLRKGGEIDSGTRSSLMWNFVEIIRQTKPKVILWENVPGALSGKMKKTYDKFYQTLIELGYKVYADILNAKDFGVPQNRDRVIVVGIRKDLNINFEMPKGYYCGIKLFDVLEDEVDESFYLSDEQVKSLLESNFIQERTRIQNEDEAGGGICGTLCARDHKAPKCVKLSAPAAEEA